MPDSAENVKSLEKRIETLERQVAFLLKKAKSAPSAGRSGDYRERFDSLDYPER